MNFRFEDIVARYARLQFLSRKPSLLRLINWAETLRKDCRSRKVASILLPNEEIFLNVDLNKWLQREVFYHGYFEYATQKIIQKYCPRGAVVADVGANIGIYTVQMSKLVGGHGKVYAFEPATSFHASLLENLQLNQCRNVIVENVIVSDDKKPRQLSVTDQTASVALYHDSGLLETVSSIQLDDYFQNIPSLDLLKIDVDGWDYHVLAGAQKTLSNLRPNIIVECLYSATLSPLDIWEILEEYSYRVFLDSDLDTSLSKSNFLEICEERVSINVFAIPDKSGPQNLGNTN